QAGLAAAVDELVGLRVELDLANPASSFLDVKAGADRLRSSLRGADARGQPAYLRDGPEIEALAPDEGADSGQKSFARRDVARAGPRADERGPLPRERRGFVMGEGGV